LSFAADIVLDYMAASFATVATRDSGLLAAADAIRAGLFPKQLAVLEDVADRKAVLCPRRSGKSWMSMSYAFDTACRNANARVVICLLVLKQAKGVYWSAMRDFAARYGIEAKSNLHELTYTLRNGSNIMLLGCESVQEIEKLRGQSFDLVIVDECKSFNPKVLKELLDDVVSPTLHDRSGTLMMIGTPGNTLSGPFYWATAPYYEVEVVDEEGRKEMRPFSRTFASPEQYWVDHTEDDLYWSRHTWTKQDNVFLPKLWAQALRDKKRNGWGDDHPTWLRESLAQWVPSTGSYVYRYGECLERTNGASGVQWTPQGKGQHGLPEGHDWRFICGMDLGFEDDFAIVVAAYSMTDGSLYHVYDWKKNHQDFFQVAEEIAAVVKRFGPFDAMVADTGGSGGKTIIETLNKHFGHVIQAAEKREKFDYIEIMNGEFSAARVKIIPGSNLDIELRTLQWLMEEDDDKSLLARTGKLKENPAQPNHLCDAWLYTWRYSHHFWASERPAAAPEAFSPEWQRQVEIAAMDRLVIARNEQAEASRWLQQGESWTN
jgi:hypothetical protein